MASTPLGQWRIADMDQWDRGAIELLGPTYIEFTADGTGTFRFIAVEASLDGKPSVRTGRPAIEFSWEGNDDGGPASGRSWAQAEPDGSLVGHIYFHRGDDSGFRESLFNPPAHEQRLCTRTSAPPTSRVPEQAHIGSFSTPGNDVDAQLVR